MARTIAVTGVASGLGRAVAARLESDGARVIGVDIADAEVTADLSNASGRSSAVDAVRAACGGVLDGLVPCAGLGPQHPSEKIVAVNYFGAIATLDGLESALAAGRAPAVVMICSNSTTLTPGASGPIATACLEGDESTALARAADANPAVAYAASKVGIGRAVRRRAQPFGERGIRINSVAPGPFNSRLLQEGLDDPATGDLIRSLPIPLGRFGEPDDIAEVIAWLLGDGARYLQGANLFVDGGIDAMLSPDRFP